MSSLSSLDKAGLRQEPLDGGPAGEATVKSLSIGNAENHCERSNDDGPLLQHDSGLFDVDKYMDGLNDWDITNEEKREFLQTLCLIMKTFVDIGWGLDSVQRCIPAMAELSSNTDSDEFRLENVKHFNNMALRKDAET